VVQSIAPEARHRPADSQGFEYYGFEYDNCALRQA